METGRDRLKTYSVKEAYVTLQGEGAQTGRAAVFLRFAGCNLWSGLERDRERAVCTFCDTDFVGTDGPGGGKFRTPEALAASRAAVFSADPGDPDPVLTRFDALWAAGRYDEAAEVLPDLGDRPASAGWLARRARLELIDRWEQTWKCFRELALARQQRQREAEQGSSVASDEDHLNELQDLLEQRRDDMRSRGAGW